MILGDVYGSRALVELNAPGWSLWTPQQARRRLRLNVGSVPY